MSLRRDLHHGARIGRAEFVRSVRRYTGNPRRLVGLVIAVLLIGGNLLFVLPAAYLLGQTARSVTAIPFFAPTATALPLVLFLLATLRTLERIGTVEAEELVLATVHPRAVVVGLIAAEVARLALWIGFPVVVIVGAFALGLGAPSLPATIVLVAVPLLCWAAVWGYACGLAALRVLRRLPSLRRLLQVAGIVVLVVFFVGSQFFGRYVVEEGISVRVLANTVAWEPLTDYVALAFVGTPLARPISVLALVILAALLAMTPAGLLVATRQAETLWFTDGPTGTSARRVATSTGGFTPPVPFAWTGAGHVAWGILVRGVRNPQRLAHLVMILFFVGPFGATFVGASRDTLGLLVASAGVGVGAYLSGATFGLNPLGDDRPQLPVLLLTGAGAGTLVRGRVFAGLAVGVPVGVLVPLAAVLLGATPTAGLALAAVGVGMCLAAALFAVGLGAAYPIYEEREFWGSETVVPSTLVMIGYMFVVGGGAVIGLAVTWLVLLGVAPVSPLVGVGIGVYLLITAGASYGSYRYALGRYRQYTVG